MSLGLLPTFQLNLGDPIREGSGCACIGRFDGVHPSLVCCTAGGKLFVYSPHDNTDYSKQALRYLNLNWQASAIAAGNLRSNKGPDLLFAGSQTNLLAYNVEDNSDLFFLNVPDGVGAICIGPSASNNKQPLVVTGGNCSLQGFDVDGNEVFWTVTGGNVTAMDLKRSSLLVGTDDFDIRCYKNEEVVYEVMENDSILGIKHLDDDCFTYSLANGTVGVYENEARLWRVKSKNSPTTLEIFDIDEDGEPEIIIGWSSGKIEARDSFTGAVKFKDSMQVPVSSIIVADIRNSGEEGIIACGLDGEIRGYSSIDQNSNSYDNFKEPKYSKEIESLETSKQELLYQLESFERNLQLSSNQKSTGDKSLESLNILASAEVNVSYIISLENGCKQITFDPTNVNVLIRGILLYSEVLIEGAFLFFFPERPQKSSTVELHVKQDSDEDIKAFVMLCNKNDQTSSKFYIHRAIIPHSKFSMFVTIPSYDKPASTVTFKLMDRVTRVPLWVNNTFKIEKQLMSAVQFEVAFQHVTSRAILVIEVLDDCVVKLHCDNMELCSDIIASLCKSLGVNELEVTSDFPHEFESLKQELEKIADYDSARQRISADVADTSNLLKHLVIKAEDARLLCSYQDMLQYYRQLMGFNKDLLTDHTKRSTAHEELLSSLKKVNQLIQKASNLRLGRYRTALVTASRAAIRNNNTHTLFRILRDGTS